MSKATRQCIECRKEFVRYLSKRNLAAGKGRFCTQFCSTAHRLSLPIEQQPQWKGGKLDWTCLSRAKSFQAWNSCPDGNFHRRKAGAQPRAFSSPIKATIRAVTENQCLPRFIVLKVLARGAGAFRQYQTWRFYFLPGHSLSVSRRAALTARSLSSSRR
jgi:hypothetical protein